MSAVFSHRIRSKNRSPGKCSASSSARKIGFYYNWEITGQRLEKWSLLFQFPAILSARARAAHQQNQGHRIHHLTVPEIWNPITDAPIDGNRLTITRKST
ncbi:MAG: hypothetical protein CM1200mP29_02550 [Verrucomicrobiota bacterium]|nr:MAG: hypothetical protein CM1200mP29_02550 [Verrucomicrobiota bacterium]